VGQNSVGNSNIEKSQEEIKAYSRKEWAFVLKSKFVISKGLFFLPKVTICDLTA